MELFQVRYFLALSRTLNFTRASEECNVSQPALSRAIQQLEAELGGALFRREGKHTHMTELGKTLEPSLRHCYESAREAHSLATDFLKKGHAPLNLALSRTIGLELISPILNELTDAFPRIDINLFRGPAREISERLHNGESEIAISGPLDDDWNRLEGRKLFVEDFGLLLHRDHRYSDRNQMEVKDLAGERILSRSHCPLADEIQNRLKAIGIAAPAKHEVAVLDDLPALVRANFGVGIWPKARGVASGLTLAAIPGLETSRWIRVYTVAGRQHSAAATALTSLLRARDWSDALQEASNASRSLQ